MEWQWVLTEFFKGIFILSMIGSACLLLLAYFVYSLYWVCAKIKGEKYALKEYEE